MAGLSTYAIAFARMIEKDWRNANRFVQLLANTAKSRMHTQMLINGNPNPDGWAFQIQTPLFELTNSVALQSDGYQQATSYPSTNFDPSSVTYSKPTETQLTANADRIAIALFELAELDLANHPAGDTLLQSLIQDCSQRITDQMTSHVLSALENSGQVETGSTAAAFGLRTTSAANWRTDLKDIYGAARSQDGGSYAPWLIVLPSVYEGAISQFDTVASKDYTSTDNVAQTAKVLQNHGFNFIFDNGFSDNDSGFAVNLDKVALLNPMEMRMRAFQESADPLSDFYACYKVWGLSLLGKTIQAYDGGAVSGTTQKEGIIRLSVS
jgi:hypothetical protein